MSYFVVYYLHLFEGVSSSSGCLVKAALAYCGTPWAFYKTIKCHLLLL